MGARRMARWIKPCLTQEQRLARLRWIVAHTRKVGRKWEFCDFENTIHIDEKWFYLMKDAQKVWVLPEDGRPGAPKAQNKAFIKKLMFLAAVGRPHKRPNGSKFNGLIGIWPFVRDGFAVRSSKHRAAREAELKLFSVDGNAWRDMMVEKVFPAVRNAYKHAKKHVVIQIDGAKPHTKSSIQASIEEECCKQGYNITVERQPAQSPDFNVLDLGFFHSLQVRASQIKAGGNLQDIVDAVTTAFHNHDPSTLKRVWQALFHVFDATLRHDGGNDFPVPHVGTGAVQTNGDLPWTWNVNAHFLGKARGSLGFPHTGRD